MRFFGRRAEQLHSHQGFPQRWSIVWIPALLLHQGSAGSTSHLSLGHDILLEKPSFGGAPVDQVPCQPGTSCDDANSVTNTGLHLTGEVVNMNIAGLRMGTSQRASGRSPLCLCWDCFALNVIYRNVRGCLIFPTSHTPKSLLPSLCQLGSSRDAKI